MAQQQRLLQVKEAAEYLGVSANTIRNWGSGGKLPEFRHPINHYRLFRENDLRKVRKELDKIRDSQHRHS